MSSLEGKKILLAEDDLALLQVIGAMLERKGALVSKAVDGQQALSLFLTQPFDLILSDVQMPFLTGVDLLRRVRDTDPEIPVFLLLTGQADLSEIESVELGASALIRKPFRFTELMPIILKSLDRARVDGARSSA